MSWGAVFDIIGVGSTALNLLLIWYAALVLRRLHRLYGLLLHIAVDSFMAHHKGTFIAWSQTLGRMRITVQTLPREPGDYDP